MTRWALLAIAAAGLLACTTGRVGDAPGGDAGEVTEAGGEVEDPGPAFDPGALSAHDAAAYLGQVAPPLVGRVLSDAEAAQIEESGGAAIAPIVSAWTQEQAFIRAGRTLIEQRLNVGGVRDGVDFNIPGRIVEHVIRHGRPWSEILTSETCYDEADQPMACDTGAPYAAGVLGTRAYLISRSGRFNLTRASTMMKTFACRGYPMEADLQPPLAKEVLQPMFRATSKEDQTDPRAASGFGDGFACYACHGQFGAHAQLFVKFDDEGLWHEGATGEQDPEGELGRSYGGLFASHMVAPEDAASERSQMFGAPVDNLAAAARQIAASPTFLACSARNILEYALLVDPSVDVPAKILDAIADRALERGEPTFGDLVVATLTDPQIIQGVITKRNGGER